MDGLSTGSAAFSGDKRHVWRDARAQINIEHVVIVDDDCHASLADVVLLLILRLARARISYRRCSV